MKKYSVEEGQIEALVMQELITGSTTNLDQVIATNEQYDQAERQLAIAHLAISTEQSPRDGLGIVNIPDNLNLHTVDTRKVSKFYHMMP
jgi:hypothetical protein